MKNQQNSAKFGTFQNKRKLTFFVKIFKSVISTKKTPELQILNLSQIWQKYENSANFKENWKFTN